MCICNNHKQSNENVHAKFPQLQIFSQTVIFQMSMDSASLANPSLGMSCVINYGSHYHCVFTYYTCACIRVKCNFNTTSFTCLHTLFVRESKPGNRTHCCRFLQFCSPQLSSTICVWTERWARNSPRRYLCVDGVHLSDHTQKWSRRVTSYRTAAMLSPASQYHRGKDQSRQSMITSKPIPICHWYINLLVYESIVTCENHE